MRRAKAVVLLCLLFFYTINITNLKSRPATVDDLDSIKHIYGRTFDKSLNLAQTIESVSIHSPEHAPAYYAILNIWRMLVGEDLFLARLLSVHFGLVALSLAYRLARLTRNQQAILAAPIIMALLAYLQYYSQIARVYSLMLLVSGWLLWAYWQVVKTRTVGSRQWLSLFGAVATSLYVHYFGSVVLAAIAIYHLCFAPKTRRWLSIVAVLALACLTFIAWLPTMISGFMQSQNALSETALSLPVALMTVLRIYANGLWFLPIAAGAILLLNRRRLNRAEIYLIVVTAATLLILLLVNEITPILAERRMRYTLVLALPLSCALAVALGRIPRWHALRLPLLAIWVLSSFAFAGSQDLEIYTNRRSASLHLIPHYQNFIYESDVLPGHNELVLSFHPRGGRLRSTMLRYYRLQLPAWHDIAHMSFDAAEQLTIQSSLSTYESPKAIAENSQGVWLMHNPTQTNLAELDAHFSWFTERFTFCKRFLDEAESVIDYFLKMPDSM